MEQTYGIEIQDPTKSDNAVYKRYINVFFFHDMFLRHFVTLLIIMLIV